MDGGGDVGYSTEVLEQTSLQKPFTIDAVRLDCASRWLSGLLGTQIPFDDSQKVSYGNSYKYQNFRKKTPLSALVYFHPVFCEFPRRC